MSRFVYLFAICFAVLAGTSVRAYHQLDVHRQCLEKRYAGACVEAPVAGIYHFRCSDLYCAKDNRDGTYKAESIGRAADDTHCGAGKQCYRGQCSARLNRNVQADRAASILCSGMPTVKPIRIRGQKKPIYLRNNQ